jgi:hypothetical protein
MFKIYKKYYPLLTGAAVFIIYLTTIAPSVIQIDSGELAAVQLLPGVAHPTGYPLFTIIGYLFGLIPMPFTKIFQMNLLAALYTAAGAGIFVYTARFILENINKFTFYKAKTVQRKKTSKHKRKKEIEPAVETKPAIIEEIIFLAAVFGGLSLAFSKTFWFQSVSVEVYSLHILLINLIILFLVKAYVDEDDPLKVSFKSKWMLFAFFLALGFTNHMTTLLILPGVAYLYFSKYKFNKISFKRIGLMLVIFFPVLILIYSYLPAIASTNPYLNWGNPVDMERIIRHVQGKQYQVWLFSSTDAAKKQLEYFVTNLPREFTVILIFSAAGIIASFKLYTRFFYFFIISFFFTVIYSINYDISDIDAYFLLAYISLAFFAVIGFIQILQWIKPKKYSYTSSAGILAAVILFQIFITFKDVDQSNNYTFEDYTKALVGSVSENGIIFSYQWDFFLSASYYFQFVENYRRDAAVVDKELLRRSWYYNQLETCYPGLLNGVQNEVGLFLKAVQPFERSENYDANLLESLFRRIMTGIAAANLPEKDFYVAPEIVENEMQRGEFTLPEGYTLIPDLFLFKAVKGNEYVPAADPDFKIRFLPERNYYTKFIETQTGAMLTRRALYEMQFDKTERAQLYINKVREDFPNFVIPAGLFEALEIRN